MAFGIDKCNKLTVKRGTTTNYKPTTMEDDQQLKFLDISKYYLYLGFSKRLKTNNQTKSALIKEYFSRPEKWILKQKHNRRHQFLRCPSSNVVWCHCTWLEHHWTWENRPQNEKGDPIIWPDTPTKRHLMYIHHTKEWSKRVTQYRQSVQKCNFKHQHIPINYNNCNQEVQN